MSFALIGADTWTAVGFHAAIFLAVVFVLLAIQWLFDGRGRP